MSLRIASLDQLGKGAWKVANSAAATGREAPPAKRAPQPTAPKAPRTRQRKAEREGEEQAELLEQVALQFPDLAPLLIHIPNGGSRKNAFEGWRLKRQGVRAGVSDLLLPHARGGFFGLWIEFKAAPPNDAAVSDSQLEWLELMRAQGYRAEVCLGAEAALAVITDYLAQPATTPR